jgi:hypothetical protein
MDKIQVAYCLIIQVVVVEIDFNLLLWCIIRKCTPNFWLVGEKK